MHPAKAAAFIDQMNAGIVARIISPAVMESKKAAEILNNLPFGPVAHILVPTVTEPANAERILDEMGIQTAPQLISPGNIMNGMDAGSAAYFLSHHGGSPEALPGNARLLYYMRAGVVARILAPRITGGIIPAAHRIEIIQNVAVLNPVQMYLSSSTYQSSSYGEGGHSSHHEGQIAGVSAGSPVVCAARGIGQISRATDTHCASGEHCASSEYCPGGGCINDNEWDAFSVLDAQQK